MCTFCVLGVSDISSVSHDSSLGSLGLDSLMSVEVKQLLEREFDLVLSMKEIRALTIATLREKASANTDSNTDITTVKDADTSGN